MAELRRVMAEREERVRVLGGTRARETHGRNCWPRSRIDRDFSPPVSSNSSTVQASITSAERVRSCKAGHRWDDASRGSSTRPGSFSQSIASGDPSEFELRARRCDDAYRWFQARGFPLRDSNGHIVSWYYLLIDIKIGSVRRKLCARVSASFDYSVETIPALVWAVYP